MAPAPTVLKMKKAAFEYFDMAGEMSFPFVHTFLVISIVWILSFAGSKLSPYHQSTQKTEICLCAGKVVDLQDMLAKTCLHHTSKDDPCQSGALSTKLRPFHKTHSKQVAIIPDCIARGKCRIRGVVEGEILYRNHTEE